MARQLVLFLSISLVLSACDYLDFKGMVITYTDVDERFDASVAWNDANPSRNLLSGKDDYSFFIISDSHLGGTVNINKVYADAIAKNGKGVIMIGDNCSGNKTDYDMLANVVEQHSTIPSYLLVGNHDLYFEGWEHFYTYFGSSTYSFSIKTPDASDLFIMLDTGGGTLGKLQLQWLKDLLATERKNFRNCIILTHNNILRSRYTVSTLPMQEEVKVLLDLFLQHNVNYCFTGHDHQYDTFTFGNTHYVVSDAIKDGYKKASYLILNIKDGTISVSQQPINE